MDRKLDIERARREVPRSTRDGHVLMSAEEYLGVLDELEAARAVVEAGDHAWRDPYLHTCKHRDRTGNCSLCRLRTALARYRETVDS